MIASGRRPDARAKLRGEILYGIDLDAPGMLWGALVPAPVARGRVRSLDLGPARARPGVVALGPDELARGRLAPVGSGEEPIFATEIAYRGQPIAAVAAPTREAARRAASLVTAVVDELPAVEEIEAFDPARASPSAPTPIGHVSAEHGDVDAAFARAELVLEETYRTSGVHQVPLEPHACLAEIRGESWHVRTSTQSPFGAREDVAALLGLPQERVVVEGSWVGGAFGSKGAPLLEPYALLLAKASGRPVRLALDYPEEFRLGRTSLPSTVTIASATREGRITARRVVWRLDAGAALPGRDFATGYAAPFLLGPYAIPAYALEAYALRTNKPPLGPHRAPMAPQCAFVVESHMDHLAARLGSDPIAFRRSHAWRTGDETHLGQPVGPFGLAPCLLEAERIANRWRSETADGEGVGVGVGFWSTGTGAGGEAVLRLGPTGLVVIEGEREIGSGSVAVGLAAVAERTLGLPRERISVEYAATDRAPFDSGVYGSRTVGALGRAVQEAALALRRELGRRLGVPEEAVALRVEGGELLVVAGPTSRPLRGLLSVDESREGGLVREGRHYGASGPIDARRVRDGAFYPYTDFTAAVHVAHVAVDRETGATRVRRYAAVHDVGVVVDRASALASIEGGIVMGLGSALTEEMLWSEGGVLMNPGLLDYRLPTITEVPPIEIELIEGHPGAGPFGAKGLGEPPIIPVPATISNAIFAAVRAPLTELPMTPERVARALNTP